MSGKDGALHLFEAFGIELEYMIVRRDTLAALPVSDRLIHSVVGEFASDVEDGPIAWSNELVLHVIELKTNGPTPTLSGLFSRVLAEVHRINALLEPFGGALLPGAAHPTFHPATETRLWPHDAGPVYAAYDRIFDCRGHGWSNLQAMHLNLPFCGDAEFGRLHAAIRAVLPLLPGLAAASPVIDGRATGLLDTRLDVYRKNQARIPSIAGRIVPEPVWTEAEYRERILARTYADVAPLDPEGVLQHEFLNSRGAIARFERDAIEIRLIDMQESPAADVGVALLVSEVVKALACERFASLAELKALDTEPLALLLDDAIRDADRALIRSPELLRVLGLDRESTVGDAWRHLHRTLSVEACAAEPEVHAALATILRDGPLARRILSRLGWRPGAEISRAAIDAVWRELSSCLVDGRSLRAT